MESSDEPIANAIHNAGRHAHLVARRPLLLDGSIAVLLGVTSLIGLIIQRDRLQHHDTIVFCIALVLPLTLRTIDRRLSFALISGIALIQWLTSTPQIADASVLVALFWIALDGELLDVACAAAVVEGGGIMAALRWSPSDPLKYWVGITALGVAAAAIGLVFRERRQLIASLEERTARLELERDQEGRLGAAAERARIAREMHDIVSHNLTVMIALADAARYSMHSAPEQADSTVERIAGTGRRALGEMRRLLGVLRDQPMAEPFEPQPSLTQLDDLIARVEAAGLSVSLELQGDPHSLYEGVQVTIYRIVQEALTNSLKHAIEPTGAVVKLVCPGDGSILLEILDDGRAPTPRDADSRGATVEGRGLLGMRERANAYGGTVEAGPRPQGGWSIRLQLSKTFDKARVL